MIASNVPITVDRQVKVTSVHGGTAIVADDLTIHAGTETLPSDHTYALDRTTLEGVAPPEGIAVEPSVGALSSAFPIGPAGERRAYRFYDSTTRNIVPVGYAGHATREGRAVNVYTISSVGSVKDPGLLKMLPPSLPKKLHRKPRAAAASRRAGRDHAGDPRRAARSRSRSATRAPRTSPRTSMSRPASRSMRRSPSRSSSTSRPEPGP